MGERALTDWAIAIVITNRRDLLVHIFSYFLFSDEKRRQTDRQILVGDSLSINWE